MKVAQLVKNLLAMQETPVQFLGQGDPLEKGTATHSSILAWKIHGLFSSWGCKESDTTEQISLFIESQNSTLRSLIFDLNTGIIIIIFIISTQPNISNCYMNKLTQERYAPFCTRAIWKGWSLGFQPLWRCDLRLCIIFSLFTYDTKSNKKKIVLCMSSVGVTFVKTELLTSQSKKLISSPEINAAVIL